MPDLQRVMLVANADKASQESAILMRGSQAGNIKPSMVKAFMQGVAYLDRAGRRSYKVLIKAGTLYSNKGGVENSTHNRADVDGLLGQGLRNLGDQQEGKHVCGESCEGHASPFFFSGGG